MSAAGVSRDDRFVVTFIAPNQNMTSGGAYVIHQLALHCSSHAQVNLVVEEGEPESLRGVDTYPSGVLERGDLPPADALVIPADSRAGERLFAMPPATGTPILLFQGYGIHAATSTVPNLERASRVITISQWLVDEASRYHCRAALVRLGFDRSIFYPGPPPDARVPSVMMLTSHVEAKGTFDGLAAITSARELAPDFEVNLFGHLDPGIPDVSFTPIPDRSVIAAAMRRNMILVCPSWLEGLGLPGVEAMLCGACVATSDTKGSREYAIHEGTALVSRPRDAQALGEDIARFLTDADLRQRCVSEAIRTAGERFPDWPQAGAEFMTAVRRLVNEKVDLRPSPAVSYHRQPMEHESESRVTPAAPEPAPASTPPDPAPAEAPASANGRYEFEIDLDSNSTHAKVVRLVGRDRRVLELGPATGYMSRIFVENGCSVVGLEVDPGMAEQAERYCERVIVGDLESLDLDTELGEDRFDVIVAADVLEHLKQPLELLQRLRGFLAEDGFFVLSLPNVAHGSVRLALLEGHFSYQRHGLLDETHLRFFTHETVAELLDAAELGIAEMHHQPLKLEASEVSFDPRAVPAELLEALERDPDATTYQFVIKAIPFDRPGLREIQRRMRELADDVARLREENERLRPLQDALAAISSREGQLRASLIEAHEQLLQRDEQLNQIREQLEPLRRRIRRVKGSPLGRAYLKARPLLRRAKRYGDALRKL